MSVVGALADGELHVWQGISPRETTYPDWAMLSKEEHARWRVMRPVAAARYAASHAAARKILGRYLHTAPVTLRMGRASCSVCDRAACGRPVVHSAGPPLWFSLASSGSHWLLAVSRHLIGVDLECDRPVDIEALESLALSELEREILADYDKRDRHDMFFRCWTRKEAVFKASGTRRFTTLDVQPEEEQEVVVSCPARVGALDWRVRTLDVGQGRYAAVATPVDVAGPIVHRGWPSTGSPA